MKIQTDKISFPSLERRNISLFIKRLDQIDPFISGNKWYKLKYNLLEAKNNGFDTVLTFGGAYSNHILATASAARLNGLRSIGVIRGEETLPLNFTLRQSKENNMVLSYFDRSEYKRKYDHDVLENLRSRFGNFYLIPEGGFNSLAVKGSEEILEDHANYDFICVSVGTGCTLAGIVNSSFNYQSVLGFPAIKGSWSLHNDISSCVRNNNWRLIEDYHFGGYGRFTEKLIIFINDFYVDHGIALDVLYTGKMMCGIFDMIDKDFFDDGSSILVIHTGGLQGNNGMNERFNLGLISV